jgi:hypothetical protein
LAKNSHTTEHLHEWVFDSLDAKVTLSMIKKAVFLEIFFPSANRNFPAGWGEYIGMVIHT